MQLAQRLPFHWTAPKAVSAPTPLRVHLATQSARRGTESMDRALYTCDCGYAFRAEVTTSVGCPRCGTSQAW